MTITAKDYAGLDPKFKKPETYGDILDAADLADKAADLEASGNYRILRRLPDLPTDIIADNGDVRRGIYVDCETTGLNTEKDEVIELGCIPFFFRTDGNLIQAMSPLQWYNEPSIPISDEAAEVTGITTDTVKGHKIDLGHFGAVVEVTDLVIAHNAGFDRKMLERVLPALTKKCWGCSQTQVPWPRGSNRLEWLLYKMGHFYEAHGAVPDCHAGLHAISQPLGMPRDATEREEQALAGTVYKTGLSHILEASRKVMWHVWALRAAFDSKDDLKARGYFWNGGEDGRPKAWHKEVEDADAERTWLAAKVYRQLTNTIPARFDRVTPFDRFSVRA